MKKKEIIEILGLVAIIGSLIFVGIEIRQNSLAVRGATHQSISEQVTKLYMHIATNERLSKLVSQMLPDDTSNDTSYYNLRNKLNSADLEKKVTKPGTTLLIS